VIPNANTVGKSGVGRAKRVPLLEDEAGLLLGP
jgi:hypothetical protein